ncbi:hypothetical protein [Marinomonas ostreistagni]|uniref:Uncharacterized protein n=1 Tax=Marinomonas ostreistagni TaxID=359209 RepID=A0ABS0ZFC9_9GAMM|nr:hypothetical protein [Marinomonas ostreistagni]MBJ7552108.1 hypothetical protein [Marinomonas ostreistagni]
MQSTFSVQIDSFRKVNKIQNAWSNADFKTMLTLMDFDEVDSLDDSELRDMCVMSLGDLEPDDGAMIVLTHLFPTLKRGKIEHMAHDMLQDRSWEEYPDCLFHERFFNAYELLREAYGSKFAKPTGVEMTLTVSAVQAEDLAIFDKSLAPSMVRLLASGLESDALMHRLYEDQIKGTSFPEASGIVWQLKQTANNGVSRQFSLVGSQFWLASFEHIQSFGGVAHADSVG